MAFQTFYISLGFFVVGQLESPLPSSSSTGSSCPRWGWCCLRKHAGIPQVSLPSCTDHTILAIFLGNILGRIRTGYSPIGWYCLWFGIFPDRNSFPIGFHDIWRDSLNHLNGQTSNLWHLLIRDVLMLSSGILLLGLIISSHSQIQELPEHLWRSQPSDLPLWDQLLTR